MSKPSSKEVGPAYTEDDARRAWADRECMLAEEAACGCTLHSECKGKVQFYLAAFHDGFSLPSCGAHAAGRRQQIREEKRRVKKRLAAMRVGRVPKRTEPHPDWRDDGKWTL